MIHPPPYHRRSVTPEHTETMTSADACTDLSAALAAPGRSPSIPMAPGRPERTPSEAQRHEDEAIAEDRDHAMFLRIVAGITQAQQATRDCRWRAANDRSLARVLRTRHADEEERIAHWRWRRLPEKLRAPPRDSLAGILASPSVQRDGGDEAAMFILDL